MSSVSANSSFEAYREQWRSKRGLRLTEHLCNVSHFIFRWRMQMRYGELSRAPLKMLRLQLFPDVVECDWLARLPDPWDAHVPLRVGRRHSTMQTLRDSIDVRDLLFRALPDVETAYIRIYRESPSQGRELILSGCTQRNDNSSRNMHSLAMRAKVLGFRFRLEDDFLYKLPGGDKPIPVPAPSMELC
jgi:hypothetical protein